MLEDGKRGFRLSPGQLYFARGRRNVHLILANVVGVQVVTTDTREANTRSDSVCWEAQGFYAEKPLLSTDTGMQCVRGMSKLPAEVRNQQHAVENPTYEVIHPHLRREGTMTTFVRQHPDSSHASSLMHTRKQIQCQIIIREEQNYRGTPHKPRGR